MEPIPKYNLALVPKFYVILPMMEFLVLLHTICIRRKNIPMNATIIHDYLRGPYLLKCYF